MRCYGFAMLLCTARALMGGARAFALMSWGIQFLFCETRFYFHETERRGFLGVDLGRGFFRPPVLPVFGLFEWLASGVEDTNLRKAYWGWLMDLIYHIRVWQALDWRWVWRWSFRLIGDLPSISASAFSWNHHVIVFEINENISNLTLRMIDDTWCQAPIRSLATESRQPLQKSSTSWSGKFYQVWWHSLPLLSCHKASILPWLRMCKHGRKFRGACPRMLPKELDSPILTCFWDVGQCFASVVVVVGGREVQLRWDGYCLRVWVLSHFYFYSLLFTWLEI